jgi:hypothetical protein
VSDVVVRASGLLAIFCLVAAPGCGQLDVGIDPPDAADGSASESDANDEAQACLPPDHGWLGCGGAPCSICADLVSDYLLYFAHHRRCSPVGDCRGKYAMCSSDCPQPSSADVCNGTSGQWDGCRGSGCTVCVEKVSAYPKYFERHPSCKPNPGCGNTYFTCNAACPEPSSADL